jgi:hypothetical protein
MRMVLLLAMGLFAISYGQVVITDVVQTSSTFTCDSSHFSSVDSVDSIGKVNLWKWEDAKGFALDADTSLSVDSVWRLSINPRYSAPNEWVLYRLFPGEDKGILTRKIRLGHGTNIPVKFLHPIMRNWVY